MVGRALSLKSGVAVSSSGFAEIKGVIGLETHRCTTLGLSFPIYKLN